MHQFYIAKLTFGRVMCDSYDCQFTIILPKWWKRGDHSQRGERMEEKVELRDRERPRMEESRGTETVQETKICPS